MKEPKFINEAHRKNYEAIMAKRANMKLPLNYEKVKRQIELNSKDYNKEEERQWYLKEMEKLKLEYPD